MPFRGLSINFTEPSLRDFLSHHRHLSQHFKFIHFFLELNWKVKTISNHFQSSVYWFFLKPWQLIYKWRCSAPPCARDRGVGNEGVDSEGAGPRRREECLDCGSWRRKVAEIGHFGRKWAILWPSFSVHPNLYGFFWPICSLSQKLSKIGW